MIWKRLTVIIGLLLTLIVGGSLSRTAEAAAISHISSPAVDVADISLVAQRSGIEKPIIKCAKNPKCRKAVKKGYKKTKKKVRKGWRKTKRKARKGWRKTKRKARKGWRKTRRAGKSAKRKAKKYWRRFRKHGKKHRKKR